MAGLPTVQVLLDDGTGTFPYDVTTKTRLVEGYSMKRGRQDEMSSPTNGDFDLVFDNTDGRFTLGSTIIASPSPIKIDAQIRVKLTANAVTVNRFTQFVQNWPVQWPRGGSEFAVSLPAGTDAQAKAEGRTLRSVIEEEILADGPVAYYTLGEPEGATSAGDTSGSQAPALTMVGSGTDVVFGTATGPGTDGLTAATFAAGKRLDAVLSATPTALEAWFSTSTIDGSDRGIIGTGTNGITVTSGNLTFNGSGSGGAVADGLVHHIVWQGTSVYLDDVLTGLAATAPGDAHLVVGSAFIGSIAHVAADGSTLSAARRTAHYQAGSTGFAGESGTARLTRLAGYANMPVGTLDASLTNVAFTDFTGRSAWDAIQEVADAEMGIAFIDGSGNLVFHNRNRVLAKSSPDVTVDANFLSPGTGFEYDMQGVLNYFEATATPAGSTQLAWDQNSEVTNKHGRYSKSKSYLVQTDQEALDRANWIVATHSEPATRVGSLVLDVLTMTAAQQAAMLTVEPSTWLRITGLPGQTPGGTTADFIVQGIAESLDAGEWTITLNAANKTALYPSVWILGTSALGVDTRLGV